MSEDVGEGEEHEERESFEEFHAVEIALFSAFATLAAAIVLLYSLDADEDTPGFDSPMFRAILGMAIAQVALAVHLVAYPSGILAFWDVVWGVAATFINIAAAVVEPVEVYHVTTAALAVVSTPLFASGVSGLASGGDA